MNTNNKRSRTLLPGVIGLVLITGMVHARALESGIEGDVYLRPEISPYVSSTESNQVSLPSEKFTVDTTIDEEPEIVLDDSSSTSSAFLGFLTNIFSKPETTENEKGVFTRLMVKLGADAPKSVSTDTNAPTLISNIKITPGSSSNVAFSWDLNKLADVTIYYGTDAKIIIDQATAHVKVSAFRFTNQVNLENLEANTTYNYVLVVENRFSKETTTSTGSFRTASQ